MHIGFNMDIYEVIFEVYLGDKLMQRQSIQAPCIILKKQFMSLTEQIANDSRPMKIKMIKSDVIWDKFEQKNKILNNYIEFRNQAMEEK